MSAAPAIALLCPACEREVVLPFAASATCPWCAHAIALDLAKVDAAGVPTRCLACDCRDLYKQRDFNRAVGCFVVLVSIAFAVHTYYVSLFLGALVDAWLYRRLPEVLVCYRCRAVHRGVPTAQAHAYELERAAVYDQYVG